MWAIVAIVVAGMPSVAFLLVWLLIAATNNLDLVFALGVSEVTLNASLLAATGLIVGAAAAAAAELRRWRVLAPPIAGVTAGLSIFLLLVVVEPGQRFAPSAAVTLITPMVAQAIAIILAVRVGASRPS